MNYQKYYNALRSARGSEEFEKILYSDPIAKAEKNWFPVGDGTPQRGIIGNQQSSSEGAFVEKITNSIDALNMLECQKRGIDLRGSNVPETPAQAAKEFGLSEQKKLISVISTKSLLQGSWDTELIDKGEGQEPNLIPKTILSLAKRNKEKIKFTHGQFNQGGSGVLPFCPKGFQLIASKRHEALKPKDKKLGFTVTRKNRRTGVWEYLKHNKKVMSFKDNEKVLNEGGTSIKLFDYFQRHIEINTLNIMLPKGSILIYVSTPDFSSNHKDGHSSGLIKHIQRYPNIKRVTKVLKTDSGTISFFITAKDLLQDRYSVSDEAQEKMDSALFPSKKGVFFLNHGQTQGAFSRDWFNKSSVDFSSIKKYTNVFVDCSDLEKTTKDEVFMADRERLRNTPETKKIKDNLEHFVFNNQVLLNLIADIEREVLNKVFSQDLSKTLNKLFLDIWKKMMGYGKGKGMDKKGVKKIREGEESDHLNFKSDEKDKNKDNNPEGKGSPLKNIKDTSPKGKSVDDKGNKKIKIDPPVVIWVRYRNGGWISSEGFGQPILELDDPEEYVDKSRSFIIPIIGHKDNNPFLKRIYINEDNQQFKKVVKKTIAETKKEMQVRAIEYRRIQLCIDIFTEYACLMNGFDKSLKRMNKIDVALTLHDLFLDRRNRWVDLLVKNKTFKEYLDIKPKAKSVWFLPKTKKWKFAVGSKSHKYNRSFESSDKATVDRFSNWYYSLSKENQELYLRKVKEKEQLGWIG